MNFFRIVFYILFLSIFSNAEALSPNCNDEDIRAKVLEAFFPYKNISFEYEVTYSSNENLRHEVFCAFDAENWRAKNVETEFRKKDGVWHKGYMLPAGYTFSEVYRDGVITQLTEQVDSSFSGGSISRYEKHSEAFSIILQLWFSQYSRGEQSNKYWLRRAKIETTDDSYVFSSDDYYKFYFRKGDFRYYMCESYRAGRVGGRDTLKNFKQMGIHEFPTEIVREHFWGEDFQRTETVTYKIKPESIRINNVPDDEFKIVFPEGAFVDDDFKGAVYIVGDERPGWTLERVDHPVDKDLKAECLVSYIDTGLAFVGDYMIPKYMYSLRGREASASTEKFNFSVLRYKDSWSIEKIEKSNALTILTESTDPERFNLLYNGIMAGMEKLDNSQRTKRLKHLLMDKSNLTFIFIAGAFQGFFDHKVGLSGRQQTFFYNGVVASKDSEYFIQLEMSFSN